MQPFEYVMALISIVVGLGITHILGAMGEAIHRLRGHGPPIKLGPTYLFWVSFILLWFVGFWWSEFKLQELQITWTVGKYLFVISYSIVLYLLAVILVPTRMEFLTDSYSYFMDGRRWFFAMLLFADVIDFFDSMLKGPEWALRPDYLISQFGLVAACSVIGFFSSNRIVQFAIATIAFVMQGAYGFFVMGILGGW